MWLSNFIAILRSAEKHRRQSCDHAFHIAKDSSPWNWKTWITTKYPVQQYTLNVEAELDHIQRSGYTPPNQNQGRLFWSLQEWYQALKDAYTALYFCNNIRVTFNKIIRTSQNNRNKPENLPSPWLAGCISCKVSKTSRPWFIWGYRKKRNIPPPPCGLRHCKLYAWQGRPSIDC